MFDRKLWAVSVICAFSNLTMAYALDPFTIGAVVGAGAGAVQSVSQVAGEVTSTANAFSDLYSEIDSDVSVSESGNRLVREIKEIESLAQEAGYTQEELQQLNEDSQSSDQAKKLSATLNSITQAVRAGKRVARLVMKLDEKAKLAQIEATQVQREQLMAQYQQIEIEHRRELHEIKEELKDLKDRRKQIEILKQDEKDSGANQFGRTGVLSFPKQNDVMEEAIRMAVQLRPALLSLILFVFLSRSVFYQIGFFAAPKYGSLIRDSILCAALLMVFPEMVRLSVEVCQHLASQIGNREIQEIDPKSLDFPPSVGLWIKTRITVEWLFQWIKFVAFTITKFLSHFGLAFLVLLFPVIIFCSQMLNFTVAWPLFLGGFISICLWPLFWNAIGLLAAVLWKKQDASLSDQLATLLFSLLQFLSPLIAISTLKGQPLVSSIRSASQLVTGTVQSGGRSLLGHTRGVIHGSLGIPGGSMTGRMIAYPVNQGIARTLAGVSRGVEAFSREKPMLRAVGSGVLENLPKTGSSVASPSKRIIQGLKFRPVVNSSSEAQND